MMETIRVIRKRGEQGQALPETAIFAVLAVIVIFGILALIPFHRTRTAAIAASYACAQFLSQSPDPSKSVYNARYIAENTLDCDWSATFCVCYQVRVFFFSFCYALYFGFKQAVNLIMSFSLLLQYHFKKQQRVKILFFLN